MNLLKKHKKNKRGFKTKREAQQYEAEFVKQARADMDMMLSSFVEVYLKDKEVELKQKDAEIEKLRAQLESLKKDK